MKNFQFGKTMIGAADPYKQWGLNRDATQEEIDARKKDLAKKHHPDKNLGNEKNATSNFQKLMHLGKFLYDPQLRKEYDKLNPLGEPSQPPQPQQSPSDTQPSGAQPSQSAEPPAKPTEPRPAEKKASPAEPNAPGPNKKSRIDCSVPADTIVAVRGLVDEELEHNGKKATITDFNHASGLYRAKLPCGRCLSLKPENLTQCCQVQITGVKGRLNSREATIQNYDEAKCHYLVKVPGLQSTNGEPIPVRRENCILEKETRVVLCNPRNADLNGKMARVLRADPSIECYMVDCGDGKIIGVGYGDARC